MIVRTVLTALALLGLSSCYSGAETYPSDQDAAGVKVVGAMKNVMWKGELAGLIDLDTIKNRTDLYGLGPTEYLSGELLIADGQSYISRVLTDSTMAVEQSFQVKAPFFVYANISEWMQVDLPDSVGTIRRLEAFLDAQTHDRERPFAFKLSGSAARASIHLQNLPAGTRVSSPAEAHQGQINYSLSGEAVDIIGFFSTEHQGIFTHHDSYLHMHLITRDRSQMGHVDQLEFEPAKMKLYLPE